MDYKKIVGKSKKIYEITIFIYFLIFSKISLLPFFGGPPREMDQDFPCEFSEKVPGCLPVARQKLPSQANPIRRTKASVCARSPSAMRGCQSHQAEKPVKI